MFSWHCLAWSVYPTSLLNHLHLDTKLRKWPAAPCCGHLCPQPKTKQSKSKKKKNKAGDHTHGGIDSHCMPKDKIKKKKITRQKPCSSPAKNSCSFRASPPDTFFFKKWRQYILCYLNALSPFFFYSLTRVSNIWQTVRPAVISVLLALLCGVFNRVGHILVTFCC